jgi:DNA repair protein RadC
MATVGTSKYVPVYKVQLVKDGRVSTDRIRDSYTVGNLLSNFLSDADREHFVVVLLDRKNQVIGINTVSIGSLTASIVHPRYWS